jgi:hypothetical protein
MGKQIAFTSGGKWTDDAYVVNADGSGERRLTRTGDSFAKHEDGIWIVNRDGSRERRIAVARLVGPFRWNDYYTPTWAPR